MEAVSITREYFGQEVTAWAQEKDDSYSIFILSDNAPTSDGISYALFEGGKMHVKSLYRPHQESHFIIERFADNLSKEFNCPIGIICDIHFDNIPATRASDTIPCIEEILSDLKKLIKGIS